MQLASVKNACYVDAQDDSSYILRRENPADERPVRPHRIPRYDRGGPSACSGPKGLKAGSDPARLRSSQLPDRQRVAPLVFTSARRVRNALAFCSTPYTYQLGQPPDDDSHPRRVRTNREVLPIRRIGGAHAAGTHTVLRGRAKKHLTEGMAHRAGFEPTTPRFVV